MANLIDIHSHSISDSEGVITIFNCPISDIAKPKVGYYSLGIHPWDAKSDMETALECIAQGLNDNKCLAVGEIGLDKLRGPEQAIQYAILHKQLTVAKHFELPIILHNVRSDEQILKLKKQFPEIKNWIVHGFSKGHVQAQKLIENGFFLSFGKSIFSDKSKSILALQNIDLKYVFFETDDSNYRIEDVYRKAADILQTDFITLSNIVSDNFNRVFGRYDG